MSQSTQAHREASPQQLRCGVLTVSDTRTIETDRGGALILGLLESAGHEVVVREIVPDDPEQIAQRLTTWTDGKTADAILLTGGTGITPRDQTYETVVGILDKELPGYGELFRMLSYEEIGPAAMLSRATGGVRNEVVILMMPGSTAAVQLAMDKLIVPEIGHLVHEATKR